MMNGWDGMGAGWWAFMSVLWLALIVAVVWAGARLFPGRGEPTGDRERPDEILDRRLARGEIDPETYESLRAKLGGGALAGRR